MALAVADFMADGQVFGMAVAAVAQGLNVFQRRRLGRDMLAAHPAWHHAMQLRMSLQFHNLYETIQLKLGQIFTFLSLFS